MGGQGVLAEGPAGSLHKVRQRQPHGDQGPEGRVQVGHQNGCGDALAGDISEKEIESAIAGRHQVAEVAAHRTESLVVIGGEPARKRQLRGRQQRALDAAGQLDVFLQGALLAGGQVVQAEFDQGIGEEPFRLDGFVAFPAQAEGAGFDPFERRVHLADQAFHLIGLSGPDGLQPPPALQ